MLRDCDRLNLMPKYISKVFVPFFREFLLRINPYSCWQIFQIRGISCILPFFYFENRTFTQDVCIYNVANWSKNRPQSKKGAELKGGHKLADFSQEGDRTYRFLVCFLSQSLHSLCNRQSLCLYLLAWGGGGWRLC